MALVYVTLPVVGLCTHMIRRLTLTVGEAIFKDRNVMSSGD